MITFACGGFCGVLLASLICAVGEASERRRERARIRDYAGVEREVRS